MSRGKETLQSLFNPNSLLLLSLLGIVFFVPCLPVDGHRPAYNFLYSCIFLLSALSLKDKRHYLITGAVLLIVLIWVAFRIDLPLLSMSTRAIQGLFFVYIVFRLIRQTAGATEVNLRVIADSISGYLLVGIMFSILTYSILQLWPSAYNFPGDQAPHDAYELSRMFYFTFITYTSTGYGEITPAIPAARSVATLIAVTGQMYVAIIIALLVGKFSSVAPPQKEI